MKKAAISMALLAAWHPVGSIHQAQPQKLACVLVLVVWVVGLKWLMGWAPETCVPVS